MSSSRPMKGRDEGRARLGRKQRLVGREAERDVHHPALRPRSTRQAFRPSQVIGDLDGDVGRDLGQACGPRRSSSSAVRLDVTSAADGAFGTRHRRSPAIDLEDSRGPDLSDQRGVGGDPVDHAQRRCETRCNGGRYRRCRRRTSWRAPLAAICDCVPQAGHGRNDRSATLQPRAGGAVATGGAGAPHQAAPSAPHRQRSLAAGASRRTLAPCGGRARPATPLAAGAAPDGDGLRWGALWRPRVLARGLKRQASGGPVAGGSGMEDHFPEGARVAVLTPGADRPAAATTGRAGRRRPLWAPGC